jgi:hypothetical protein
MPVAYRWTIKTDSVREKQRGAATAGEKHEVTRDSKRVAGQVLGAFYAALATNVPDGSNARALLEKTDSHGYTKTLAKFSGKKLATFPLGHPWGAYGAASKGEWSDSETGEIVRADGTR